MEEEWGSNQFIAEQFQRWYTYNSHTIHAPLEIERREFGFLTFFGKNMYRHIGLSTENELQRYIRQNAPAHSYHSSSYYEDPTAEMARKGWVGADLVFDLDSDHFDLPCQREHDKWICRNCGEKGFGHPPELCKCGKAQFQTETWICERCLQAAKHETQKLLDIIIQDFGVQPGDITTNFSGNRGYHIHVHSDTVKPLEQNARREIVDYIMATGLDAEYQGYSQRNRGSKPTLAEGGWRGRTSRALYDYISGAAEDKFKEISGIKAMHSLNAERSRLLKILTDKHPSNLVPIIDYKNLQNMIQKAVKLQAADIDTVVTTDIHRLIRLPNTLHGKTGWQVQTIPYGDLPDYDPLRSAIVLRGPHVKLEFREAPIIKIDETIYGPYSWETAELPLEAAMFYLCKKGARLAR